jgi:hypothetical protein
LRSQNQSPANRRSPDHQDHPSDRLMGFGAPTWILEHGHPCMTELYKVGMYLAGNVPSQPSELLPVLSQDTFAEPLPLRMAFLPTNYQTLSGPQTIYSVCAAGAVIIRTFNADESCDEGSIYANSLLLAERGH